MRFYVIKKRLIQICVATVIALILLSLSFNNTVLAGVFFGENVRKTPIYSVDTTEQKVAISFDAAWGADKTASILAILKEYNVNATFFLVGFWVEQFPIMAKEIAAAGFEIGTHSNTHPDFTKLSKEQMTRELTTSVKTIKEVTGIDAKVFRPPFGAYNNTLIEVCSELSLKPIQWDVDSLDWKGLKALDITNRICSKTKNGSIILCHNNADNIVTALRLTLETLTKKGFKFVSVSELVYGDNYYIDSRGIQHQKTN